LSAAYEFDIWGKNRNNLRSALSEVQARTADLAFSQLQLTISLARAYFHIQIALKRQEINRELVEVQNAYQKLINKRFLANLETSLNLNVVETNVAAANQNLLDIEGNLVVWKDQLKAYVAGNFLEEIINTHIVEQPLPEVPLPRSLPLHLLSNRPDIMAQLWLINSAGRQIEVAKANFFPDFNLMAAFFGYQTIHFRELFRWASSYFNVDPAFTLPIFDGGRRIANLQQSRSDYDIAVFRYNNMVLEAAQEVLNGIAVLKNNADQLDEFKKEFKAQYENFNITELRVKNHIDSELELLLSRQNMLQAQDRKIIALGNTLQSILSLIKALGGGYDACCQEG
jgi:NodT family efflux transporter outer membrane factor (OMF) lipoprotein